jgi:hypothetical protein
MGTGFTVFDSIGGDSGAFDLRDDGTSRLFIATNGAATFSGTITSLATSGQATIIAEGSATNGEGAFTVKGKNSSGTIRSCIFKYDNADILRIGTASAIDMRFETSDVERMRISSGGNIFYQFGSNRRYGMDYDFSGSYFYGMGSDSTARGLRLMSCAPDASVGILFATGTNGIANVVDRMQITAGGNILMGTSSDNGERLYVSGAIRATGTITANSDIRIKSNIIKIENALEKVGQISGYTYNTNYDEKRHGGVIAQEIDKVFPEIVNTGNDGLMGVEYGNISALLIEAIKEQNTKIKNLETLLASK